jgi:hypothetical protein
MNNNSEHHNPTLTQKLGFFFSDENGQHVEGRIMEHLSLGNIAQVEGFLKELPLAVEAAREVASKTTGLPTDKINSKWFAAWVASFDRDSVIEHAKALGFDPEDPSIFLTFDMRLEKVSNPTAIDFDVSLTSKEAQYVNSLPAVLSFTRVKLLAERDLKG